MDLSGKVVLVTGGASGLGRITASRLASKGARVAILDVNEAELDATAKGASNITGYVCDVSDLGRVERTVAEVERELGPIERLVHCAAIMPGAPFREQTADQVMRVMTINYGGTVNMIKTILPLMEARGRGEIVIYGSVAGEVPMHNLSAYCAAKAATNAFVEVLVHENRRSPIRFLLVCPSMVDTPLVDQAIEAGPASLRLARTSAFAARQVANPHDIVDAVDAALERGKAWVIRPETAAGLARMRRFFPGVLWWVLAKANQQPT